MSHGSKDGFGILGPLEIQLNGQIVHIGSPKLRILLATLLLNARRPVTTARLAEAIWNDSQPVNPRRALQVYATRLRALGNAVLAGAIVTCPDGYRVDVLSDQLDLDRFEALLELADQTTDLESEVNALAEALSLYRAEPLADIPSELLQREAVPQLQEKRLAALERYFEAELRRGRHAGLVGQLAAEAGLHPFRERLWVQLMTALHRSGRRADALDAYHRIRRQLVLELGLDPGPELDRLHAEILAGNAENLVLVPRELPPDIRGFTGRSAQLSELDALLTDLSTPVVCLITGSAGVGKTTLALHWARRAADHFSDGQLWADLRGHEMDAEAATRRALTKFLRVLGVPGRSIPSNVDEQISLYRTMTDGRRMLVVLDNASGAEQVSSLLPGGLGCLVLATSRSKLSSLVSASAAHPVTLDLFTNSEARELLVRRLGTARVERETEAVRAIIGRCARLPLALAIVAARAAINPRSTLETIAAQLAAESTVTEMRATFSWSYRSLSAGARRLFRLLGRTPGPDISEAAAASLAGMSATRVRRLLAELCEAHLLNEHAGRYSFHDLLRAYAGGLAERSDAAAVHRILDHYLHTAYTAAMLLYPKRTSVQLPERRAGVTPEELSDHHEALIWYSENYLVLHEAIAAAARAGLDVHVWQLAWSLVDFLDRQGPWKDLVTTQEWALEAAQRLGDEAASLQAHRFLGRGHARLGNFADAHVHFGRALELCRELDDVVGQAHSYHNIGWVYELQGREEQALGQFQQALSAFCHAGFRHGEAVALNAIGYSLILLGRAADGLDYCARALALHQELDNRFGQATTWDSIGYAHFQLGQHAEALVCYESSLELFRDLGERDSESTVLVHVGEACQASGDHGSARDAWQHAATILEELGHPDAATVRARVRELDPPGAPRERARRGAT